MTFELPDSVQALVDARNRVRHHYAQILDEAGCEGRLNFTFDGNLVGDIGEAVAVEQFGVKLVPEKSRTGIDGFAPDGRTVQVKATGTGRGPAFRCIDLKADHLLFFDFDFVAGTGQLIFNGPEELATQSLPKTFKNQRCVSRKQIELADEQVPQHLRLKRIA